MDANSTFIYNAKGQPLVDSSGTPLSLAKAAAMLQGDLYVGGSNLPNAFQQFSQNTILYTSSGTLVTDSSGKPLTIGAAGAALGIAQSSGSIFGFGADEEGSSMDPGVLGTPVPPHTIVALAGGATVGWILGGPLGAGVGAVFGAALDQIAS
jgi:hypothetical protein